MKERTYICCDLKSFYASVECIERGLNPLDTNLVVADLSRTEKTICLAVTPSLKSYGISGRARLFEVIQRVKEVNAQRQRNTPGRQFTSASSHDPEVRRNPSLALDYIVAPPRMAHYIDWSTRVYSVYLKHVAPEDIYPYSIDEVFIDATSYLQTYHLSAREFARKIILDILQTTGITAAAGIGTNLYLAKVAMDIGAKHVPADEYGVRIAELDEMGYRRSFWTHRPLTDFWRVGKGYAAKLEANGLYTMGDIARCSIGQPTDYHNEELLYKLFGVNAELLIDHAWGWEPCTIADIAAQFAPFAALSGHSAALVETARLTDQRMELDEDARAALDSKQQLLLERIKERPEITVTWFQPDAKKDGGRYIVSTGRLKRIHEADQVLILVDGLRIPIGDIVELESECIRGLL